MTILKIAIFRCECRLIRMVLIIVGSYAFLWGKSKETKCVVQQKVEEAEEHGRLSTGGPIGSQLSTTTLLEANISDIDVDENGRITGLF